MSTSAADAWRSVLLGSKRDEVLTLEEVLRTGEVVFGDAGFLQLYGMAPADYHARGLRISGRTAIECMVDQHAIAVAEEVGRVLREQAPGERPMLCDFFTGSGNFLYHTARATQASQTLGFESDPIVYELTRANFARLGFETDLRRGEFQSFFAAGPLPGGEPMVILVAPPWGKAFSFEKGLDLRLTTPPVASILELIRNGVKGSAPVLCVIQTHESVVEDSIRELEEEHPVLGRGVTSGGRPGTNVGYLICSARMPAR